MLKEQKIKMTRFELDALRDLAGKEAGLRIVMEFLVTMGSTIAKQKDTFWSGIRARTGLKQTTIAKADVKSGLVTWTEEEKQHD